MKNILLLLFLLMTTININSQNTEDTNKSPLSGFDPYIGGEWQLGETYQVFEWGVGKKSVKSKSYFVMDGKPTLASEGYWFWHPGEETIIGYFTAVNMPASLFEYTTDFEDNRMISTLITYDDKGSVTKYKEIMDFKSEKNYEWSLYQDNAKIMNGTFSRKNYK